MSPTLDIGVKPIPSGAHSAPGRRIDVDILRLIAILLVTSFHIARWLGYDSLFILRPLKTVFMEGGDVGVCLFFFLSGFCHSGDALHAEHYGTFLIRKFMKLAPPYYVAIAIWIILVSLGIAVKPIGIRHVVLHMLFLHAFSASAFYSISGVFWFLGVIFQMYVLCPVFMKLCKRGWLVGMLSCLVPFALSLYVANKFTHNNPVVCKGFFMYAPCFMMGMLQRKHPLTIGSHVAKFIFISVALGLLTVKMPLCRELSRVVKASLLAMSMLQMGSCAGKLPAAISSIVQLISVSSYSIYLYNYIFYAYKPVSRNSATMLCSIGIVFGFGILMYHLVERPLWNKVGMLLPPRRKQQNQAT